MLVRSCRTAEINVARTRVIKEEETQLFVNSVVGLCRLDGKSHGNAAERTKFYALGKDDR